MRIVKSYQIILQSDFYDYNQKMKELIDDSLCSSKEWLLCSKSADSNKQIYKHACSSQKRQSVLLQNVSIQDVEAYSSRERYSFPFCPIVFKSQIIKTDCRNSQLLCHLQIILEYAAERLSNSKNRRIHKKLQGRLQDIVEGFAYLCRKYGPFNITPGMIGMNQVGVVKVWLSEDWSSNKKQPVAGQEIMIKQLAQIIQEQLQILVNWQNFTKFDHLCASLKEGEMIFDMKSLQISSDNFLKVEQHCSKVRFENTHTKSSVNQNSSFQLSDNGKNTRRMSKFYQLKQQHSGYSFSRSRPKQFVWYRPSNLNQLKQKPVMNKFDPQSSFTSMKNVKHKMTDNNSLCVDRRSNKRKYSQNIPNKNMNPSNKSQDIPLDMQKYCKEQLENQLENLFVFQQNFDQIILENQLDNLL